MASAGNTPDGAAGDAAGDAAYDRLRRAFESGDEAARAQLFTLLYDELHARAKRLARQHGGHETVCATAIVNEVFVRIAGAGACSWKDRDHFLAAASRAMRHVLIDYARARGRLKRTPDGVQLGIEEIVGHYEERAVDLEALDRALTRMVEFNPEMARAVELRFFGGASVDETARLLGMPKRTLERRWEAARAWLRAEIG